MLLSDDITSGRIIRWLTEVFARFGNPSIIVTDNGRQFVSSEFEAFLQQRDILHWTAAVYNPQQNGKVKAFNRFLKHGAQTFRASSRQFANGIQDLLFNYRATSPTPDGRSPAELLFGRRMRTNYEPARRAASRVQNAASEHGQNYQVEQQLPKLRGPYQLHDLVRVRLPHVPKGSTPFSEQRRITAVLWALHLSTQWWSSVERTTTRTRPPGAARRRSRRGGGIARSRSKPTLGEAYAQIRSTNTRYATCSIRTPCATLLRRRWWRIEHFRTFCVTHAVTHADTRARL